MSANMPWLRPVFFKRNRVFRVYLGGKLFHDFLHCLIFRGDSDYIRDTPYLSTDFNRIYGQKTTIG